jgi:hypothetical protein|tara:strand:- start:306 stop:533 length:228 start_codon:yes stop_codon:yes gene_type:complete
MEINMGLIILFAFRSLLVSLVIYYAGNYIDSHPPKNKFLFRIWKRDTKVRKLCIKYFWQIGVLFFLIQIIFTYLL